MKKRLMLALMLLLCAVLLAACTGEGKKFNVLSSNNGGSQQNAQSSSQGQTEDPLAEEDDYVNDFTAAQLPTQAVPTNTPAPTVRSEYAGATPVVIDPIDKPTPTAVPKLSVTYTAYDAIKLGLSFEGPAGWLKDDSSSTTFIIQNPNPNNRLDYAATLVVQAEKVTGEYTTAGLKTLVNGLLDSYGSTGFTEYEPSQTAERTLLGKNGVYANYTGTLENGAQVAGRVHVVCVDKMLYTIHLSAPRAQWNDYKEMVYDKLRDTITIVK